MERYMKIKGIKKNNKKKTRSSPLSYSQGVHRPVYYQPIIFLKRGGAVNVF